MNPKVSCFVRTLSFFFAAAMLSGCARVPIGEPHGMSPSFGTIEVREFSVRAAQELSVISENDTNDTYSFIHYDAENQLTWLLCGSEVYCVDSDGDTLNRVALSGCGTVQAYFYDADYERLLVTAIPDLSSLPASAFLDINTVHEAVKRTTLYCYSMDGTILWSVPFDHLVWRTVSKHGELYYLIDETDGAQATIIRTKENGEAIQSITLNLNTITLLSANSEAILIHAYEEIAPNEAVDDKQLSDWLKTGALFTVNEDGTYKKAATVGSWTYPICLDTDENDRYLLFGAHAAPTGFYSEPDITNHSVSIYAMSDSGDVRLVVDLTPILFSGQEADCFPVLNNAQMVGDCYYLFGQYQGSDGVIAKQFVLILDASFCIVEAYSFFLGENRYVVSVLTDPQEIKLFVSNIGSHVEAANTAAELWRIERATLSKITHEESFG